MPMTDMCIMPWGKHKGKQMRHVPKLYLTWVSEQDWIHKWPDIDEYIRVHITDEGPRDEEPEIKPEPEVDDSEEAPF